MAKPSKTSDGVPRARRSGLVALAEQLGGRALGIEVGQAVDDPHDYLAEFAERMDDIGVDEPREDLGWLAITEGLTAREVALELDWKHEARDGLAQLERLAGRAGKKALAACHADPELDLRPFHEALELFGKALAGAGRALICLDKGSDSYVVMVVDAHRVKDLIALAKKAGGVLTQFDGSKLAAYEAERNKKAKKDRRDAASTNRWTQLVHASTEQTAEDVLWQLRHHEYPLDAIRAAIPDAPAKIRPLIEMVVAVHGDPAKTARLTKDPATCLRALRYLNDTRVDPSHWFAAAATLATRLKVKPGSKQAIQVCEAVNMFCDDASSDRGLATLNADARALLARIADGTLKGAAYQSDRCSTALRALRSVGDELSMPGLEATRAKAKKWFPDDDAFEDVDDPIARIKQRAAPPPKKKR